MKKSSEVGWLKRRQAVAILGGQCMECKLEDPDVLQITPSGTGNSYYNQIIRDPRGYKIFCANCNQRRKRPTVPDALKARFLAWEHKLYNFTDVVAARHFFQETAGDRK